MKKLKRLLLINWLNYSFELMDFGKITFLTGKNASGKSTIIDAMQLVMLGDTSGKFFNKAANDKSGRTLESYLYGYIPSDGDQNYRPLRTKAFTSYVVLEFEDEDTGNPFTLGFVADCPKESQSRIKHRWLILRQSGIPSNNFLNNENIPLSIRELREMLSEHFDRGRSNQYELFDSGKEFRENELITFGKLNTRYHQILSKAVSFTPITNITNFITEYICSVQNEIDISSMQESIRNYTSLEETARITEERIKALSEIREQYRHFAEMNYKQKLYDYFLKRVLLEEEKSKLDDKRAKHKDTTVLFDEIKVSIDSVTDEINALENRLNMFRKELYSSSTAKMKENLEKAIEALEEERSGINADASHMTESITNLSEYYGRSIEKARKHIKENEEIPGESILLSVGNVDMDRITELNYSTLSSAVGKIKDWFREKNSITNQLLTEKLNEEKRLEVEIGNLKKGIKSYPESVLRFREECEKVFGRKIDILADVIEVEDLDYQNAIESYLGNRRFFLILNENERAMAQEILEKAFKKTGAGFITAENLRSDTEEETISSLISSEDQMAIAYVSRILQNIKREGCPSLRNDGLLILEEDTSALKELKSLFLGRRSIEEMLKRNQIELDTLKMEIKDLSDKKASYRNGSLGPSFEPYQAEDYERKAERIRTLWDIEKKIEAKKKELDGLDLFALDELERKIKDAEMEKKAAERKKDELIEKSGVCKSEISQLEEEIPKLENRIIDMEDEIKNDYPDDMEDDFKKSYSANESKKNIIEQYTAQQKRFTTASKNIKDKLVSLREAYNRTYHLGLNTASEDNAEYDKEYISLSENKLPEYIEKIKEAKESAYRQFKNDFLNKMSDNIKSSERQIKRFNRVLSKYHFGDDSYEFSVKAAKGYEQYYRMFTSEELTAGTDSLFSQIFLERYQKELDELFEILLPSQNSDNDAEKQKSIQKHIDYKTYLSFDLKVHGSAGSQNLSETIIVKSGGEVQIPFYISVLASFAQICRINDEKQNDTVRLVIFDEAFSKMDGERIRECLRLLEDFDLQVIFSAPPEKTLDAASFADRIIVAYKKDLSSYTRSFTPGELKNETTV